MDLAPPSERKGTHGEFHQVQNSETQMTMTKWWKGNGDKLSAYQELKKRFCPRPSLWSNMLRRIQRLRKGIEYTL